MKDKATLKDLLQDALDEAIGLNTTGMYWELHDSVAEKFADRFQSAFGAAWNDALEQAAQIADGYILQDDEAFFRRISDDIRELKILKSGQSIEGEENRTEEVLPLREEGDVRSVLHHHWLFGIECNNINCSHRFRFNHTNKDVKANCSCGWISPVFFTVIGAVESWARHIILEREAQIALEKKNV